MGRQNVCKSRLSSWNWKFELRTGNDAGFMEFNLDGLRSRQPIPVSALDALKTVLGFAATYVPNGFSDLLGSFTAARYVACLGLCSVSSTYTFSIREDLNKSGFSGIISFFRCTLFQITLLTASECSPKAKASVARTILAV